MKHPIRKIFLDNMRKVLGKPTKNNSRVSLLLSSGLDSMVVGLTAQELGFEVDCYTFQMKDHPTFDSKHAANVAQKMDWNFNLVECSTNPDTIAKAWRLMNSKLYCRKKRDYECTYPMLYCYKRIATNKHRFVLSGLVADAYFCFARNTHIAGISGPKSDPKKFREYREQYWRRWFEEGVDGLDEFNNPSSIYQHELLARKYNLITVNPFLDKRVYDYMIQRDWLELNHPHQKMPLREAWSKEIDLLGHRPHRGYQTEAKVPMYFEQLLEDSEINFKNRKRIMDVARDWQYKAKEETGLF